jgi:hypothetical protein
VEKEMEWRRSVRWTIRNDWFRESVGLDIEI